VQIVPKKKKAKAGPSPTKPAAVNRSRASPANRSRASPSKAQEPWSPERAAAYARIRDKVRATGITKPDPAAAPPETSATTIDAGGMFVTSGGFVDKEGGYVDRT